MNKIQKRVLVFAKAMAVMSSLLLMTPMMADSIQSLGKADSLFREGKFTESFEIYNGILEGGNYSPSMLLKLAYIEEGLGNVGGALYYLNLYYNQTSNKLALSKLEEIARENQLSGYEFNDFDFFLNLYHRFQLQTIGLVITISLLLLGFIIYQKKKEAKRPYTLGIAYLFALTLLFFLINFGGGRSQGIVVDPQTFLMTGPSAGSDVVEVIERGHRVKILGKEGIWLRIEWRESEVFVREGKVMSLI